MDPLDEFEQCWSGLDLVLVSTPKSLGLVLVSTHNCLGLGLGGLDYTTDDLLDMDSLPRFRIQYNDREKIARIQARAVSELESC